MKEREERNLTNRKERKKKKKNQIFLLLLIIQGHLKERQNDSFLPLCIKKKGQQSKTTR